MSSNIYNNLPEKELRAGYWWVVNRVMIRQFLITILGLVALFFLLFGLFGILKVYVVDKNRNEAIENDLMRAKLNHQVLAQVNSPQNLQILNSWVLRGNEQSFDFVAEVVNPNDKWVASSFDYYFVFGDQKTEVRRGNVLPGETNYLLDLNFISDSSITETSLIIENIDWLKVDDFFAEQKTKMLNFEIKNIVLVSSQSADLSDKSDVANITFEVLNHSNYNYWDPHFTILIYRRNSLLAVGQVTMKSLDSGEKKVDGLNLFQYIPRDVEIKIIPRVNILDPKVLKGFSNEQKFY